MRNGSLWQHWRVLTGGESIGRAAMAVEGVLESPLCLALGWALVNENRKRYL